MQGLGQIPPGGRIFGFPADAVIRVGLAVFAAGLSGAAILAMAMNGGGRQAGPLLAMSGGMLGLGLVAGRAIEEESLRAAARDGRRLA